MIFKSSLKEQSPYKAKNQLETENKSEELWKVSAVVLSTTFTFMAALYHRCSKAECRVTGYYITLLNATILRPNDHIWRTTHYRRRLIFSHDVL